MSEHPTSFRLTKETKERIKKIADHEMRSVNNMVVVLINKRYEELFGKK